MTERDWVEQLNEALRDGSVEGDVLPDSEIRELVSVAIMLRDIPRETFRGQLRAQLKERAMASTTTAVSLREGFHSLTPYIIVPGAAEFIEFLKRVFGAEEKLRVPTQDQRRIMHAEVKIGDCMIELGDGNDQYPPRPASIHIYVPDADSTYQEALAEGATSLHRVEEMSYGERSGSVKDPFGNHWYIATHHGSSHIPQGLRAVNSFLHVTGADTLIEFLKKAFDAEEVAVDRENAGSPIRHAMVRFGDSILEMSEAHDQYGPMPTGLHFYVPDVDAVYERAIRAGARSISAPADHPYGERGAGVTDPAGNSWFVATPLRSPE
jgi:uncharacterized glyoxalase superfamily protein PhnB